MAAPRETLSLETVLTGVLALLATEREDRLAPGDRPASEARKTEVILADAGLTAGQIAPLLGKTQGAVAKTIQRSRARGNNG